MYNVQIRAGYKDSVGWGKFVSLPPPLYTHHHDVYQVIGFSWV